MKKKIIVAYLSSIFSNNNDIKTFVKNYRKYNPSCKHKLIICFKKLNNTTIKERLKTLKGIKHEIFIDPENVNDFDFGTLKRLSQKYKNNYIFWMNDYSYPCSKNWLKIIVGAMGPRTIVATSASYSSHYSNSFTRNKNYSFIKFFSNIFLSFINFPRFPNPHFRTTNFMINSDDFYKYIKNKKINSKLQAHSIESGYTGLTRYFERYKFNIIVINKDIKKFKIANFHESETFAYKKISKNLTSDKKSRNFDKLNFVEKKKRRKQIWGL
mgnify:CR=1 FL=1